MSKYNKQFVLLDGDATSLHYQRDTTHLVTFFQPFGPSIIGGMLNTTLFVQTENTYTGDIRLEQVTKFRKNNMLSSRLFADHNVGNRRNIESHVVEFAFEQNDIATILEYLTTASANYQLPSSTIMSSIEQSFRQFPLFGNTATPIGTREPAVAMCYRGSIDVDAGVTESNTTVFLTIWKFINTKFSGKCIIQFEFPKNDVADKSRCQKIMDEMFDGKRHHYTRLDELIGVYGINDIYDIIDPIISGMIESMLNQRSLTNVGVNIKE